MKWGQLADNMLLEKYKTIRQHSVEICKPLQIEDYVVQPIIDVSPPKWHLAHTTWFFETFILKPNIKAYQEFNPQFNFLFNSYYESLGQRTLRDQRGAMTRPTVNEIMSYRAFVDKHMLDFLSDSKVSPELRLLIELGLNHEQQHQELLVTDIKYSFSINPLLPSVSEIGEGLAEPQGQNWISMKEGIYEIGHQGQGFGFDNEFGRHKVYLNDYTISNKLVTNRDYVAFMTSGGYQQFKYWHAEGWTWLKENNITSPLYWQKQNDIWYHYTFNGLQKINWEAPITHISFYEASAYAAWKGCRLPTEFEWEAAASQLSWGKRWEWTNSAYLPYPGFAKAEGAVGEYNGKFMVNQMVLRGASVATPKNHSRPTYRNFFHAPLRWQFTGIRLASSAQ